MSGVRLGALHVFKCVTKFLKLLHVPSEEGHLSDLCGCNIYLSMSTFTRSDYERTVECYINISHTNWPLKLPVVNWNKMLQCLAVLQV